MPPTLRKGIQHLHYVGTALLALLAIPAIKRLNLPMHLNWRGMALFYWVGLGPRSLFYAAGFCILALPLTRTLGSFWGRYRREKLRIVFALLFLVAVNCVLPLTIAIILTTDALLIVELAERHKGEGGFFRNRVVSVVVSATYMLLGVSLVLIYNDIIVASRFPLSYDNALNQVDARFLGGRNVTLISHEMFAVLPPTILRSWDTAYFQMFLVLGATLLISAYHSTRRGLQFVGTCLSAYYLALLIFYAWPTYGPYIFCARHATEYPRYLTTYLFQEAGVRGIQALSQHQVRTLASGYYIAFPSLHVGLPVIAMWFLRPWRMLFWLLAAYTGILAIAVIVLEWHYALDVPAGIAVAAIALAMVGREPI